MLGVCHIAVTHDVRGGSGDCIAGVQLFITQAIVLALDLGLEQLIIGQFIVILFDCNQSGEAVASERRLVYLDCGTVSRLPDPGESSPESWSSGGLSMGVVQREVCGVRSRPGQPCWVQRGQSCSTCCQEVGHELRVNVSVLLLHFLQSIGHYAQISSELLGHVEDLVLVVEDVHGLGVRVESHAEGPLDAVGDVPDKLDGVIN